uniref:Uncharacterized protein n=1 Tax=Leptocylindrus danicus TaxID=163516 RepID=A0A7S2LLQ6_9STRA|mmetsp:Transcript_6517/g.9623  ORF Transcript_6517/g.9623 Transcript_6517/m.9623 type:complete len:396 (+) Transcript_6517:37-1224(+)
MMTITSMMHAAAPSTTKRSITIDNNGSNNVQQRPEATNTLMKLIQSQKWDEALERCHTHPQDCHFQRRNNLKQTVVVNADGGGEEEHKYQYTVETALSTCLQSQNAKSVPINLFRAIAKEFPGAVHLPTSCAPATHYGSISNPIMMTLRHIMDPECCSMEIFQSLIERSSASSPEYSWSLHLATGLPLDLVRDEIIPFCSGPLLFQDKYGNTMICSLSKFMHTADRAMRMKLVAEAAPECIPLTNYRGENALHRIKPNDLPETLDVVQFMVTAYPHMLTAQDVNGFTPLHRMCAWKQCKASRCMKVMMDAGACHTKLMMIRDRESRTPLSFAIERCAHFTTVLILIHRCPEAAHLANSSGETPLELLRMRRTAYAQPQHVAIEKSLQRALARTEE